MVAVNDACRYRLEEAAKPSGARTYMKHRELLADPAVDVVCIATPDRLHVPQAMDAIHAGQDVSRCPTGIRTRVRNERLALCSIAKRLGRDLTGAKCT